jgi:oligosaccharide repeat unit polymerase
MFTAYGFRNVLVELIVAPLLYRYIKQKRVPQMSAVLKLIGGIVLMIAGVEVIRGSVRMGTGMHGVDWASFDMISVLNAMEGNFDLYKTLYGIVNYIPKYHDYTYGQQLIWMTVTFLIPRAIWPGKPTSILDSLMPNIVGPLAVRGHMAMGTLAEYYGEFGILGCIICCAVLGIVCKYTKRWYESVDRTEDTMIAYSCMYPMLMIVAVRGYMPLNFEHILFFEIPVMTVALVKRIKN